MPGRITIEAAGEADYDLDKGIVTSTNRITVRYQGGVLTAQKATVNENTGDVVAQGSVHLQRGPQLLLAESLHYNFYSKKIIAQDFKLGQAPYFVQSDVLVGNQAANVYADRKSTRLNSS